MLRKLQHEQIAWVLHNFPGRPAWHPLLGLVEEVGELSHSFLKRQQGIRGTVEEHNELIRDAIGDIVIYLSDFCTAEGIDFEEAVEQTWREVKKRDWKKNAKNGEANLKRETV